MSSKLGTDAKALLKYSYDCEDIDSKTVELLTESGMTDLPNALISSKLGILKAWPECRVVKTKHILAEFKNISQYLFFRKRSLPQY